MKTTDIPTLQNFHIEGVKHIGPFDALDALKSGDAVMIDVRELNEVKLESIPLEHVLNHPMSVILERLPYISKDQNIIVACPGGVRSSKVANLLMQHGYENVASLDGGLNTWKANGLPYEGNLSLGKCCCSASPESNTGLAASPLAPKKNSLSSTDYKNLRRL
ncbi:MAG TPA: rhodanese-like domain-containing protein [Prolixibacteraceae bacterium]|jgi:rhodanese-related sulfurtransferase